MAKISRTPYNGARYVTRQISKSITLNSKMTGEALFIDAQEALTVNLPFLDNGAYFKIILKNTNVGIVTLTFASMSGIVFSDNGLVTSATSHEAGTEMVIPVGSASGSFVDVLCDGERWYVQGLIATA
tara:strand:- start:1504 stop:1887 length:384 start_codon:yes stop_codon:yes gene_type:complete